MQPPQNAFLRPGVVVLHKMNIQTGRLLKGLFIPALKEEAAGVAKHFGLNNEDTGERSLGHMHGGN